MRRRYDMFDVSSTARDARLLSETEVKINRLRYEVSRRLSLVDKARLKLAISKFENEACRLRKRLGGVTI